MIPAVMLPRQWMPSSRTAAAIVLAVILSARLTVVARAAGFSLGVAAGDVTDTTVILWTRADAPGEVRLDLAGDEWFTTIIQSIVATATEEHDLTVKLDVGSLSPTTRYFYRFVRPDDPEAVSRTGRFRTAPPPDVPAGLRFIFTGDSNFALAPFAVLAHAAREDADLFIWFGDVVVTDGFTGGTGPAFTLEEYRAKYKQIRSDPHVQDLLARMATWTGWDDHEVYDNYAGLDPDLPTEQRDAAYQAFFEFMPIRPQNLPDDRFRTYRRFRYGSSIDFFFLDARQYREVSAEGRCGSNPDPLGFLFGQFTADPACQDSLSTGRSMLGGPQLDWLKSGLGNSAAAVKFVVNNVAVTYIALLPYDRWDGYDAERRELLGHIDANHIAGVVFLTTDSHANAHNPDLTHYFRCYRPDYLLAGHVVIPELIAGPIGSHTLHGELIRFGASILGPAAAPLAYSLIDQLEGQIVNRLRLINALAFLDHDRMGYAVINVTADGRADVTYRGLRPDDARNPEVDIDTLYTSSVLPPPPPPCCCWPLLVVGAAACLVRCGRSPPWA